MRAVPHEKEREGKGKKERKGKEKGGPTDIGGSSAATALRATPRKNFVHSNPWHPACKGTQHKGTQHKGTPHRGIQHKRVHSYYTAGCQGKKEKKCDVGEGGRRKRGYPYKVRSLVNCPSSRGNCILILSPKKIPLPKTLDSHNAMVYVVRL